MRVLTLCMMAVAIAACADATRVRTTPAGAALYVRDGFICITPCVYEAPRSQFSTHTPVRVELDGYEPVESELKTAVLAGRIVGGVFTLGIVPIFKRPHTYVSRHEFVLQPVTRSKPSPASVRTKDRRSPEMRLRDAKRLRDDGLLSAQEYERVKREVLEDL